MAPKKRGGGTKRAASTKSSDGSAKKRGRPSKAELAARKLTEEATEQKESEQHDVPVSVQAEGANAGAGVGETKEATEKGEAEEKQPPSDSASKPESGATAGQPQGGARVLEKGHVYFFYRPKIDAEHPKGPADVQKFYMLLSPDDAVDRPAKDEAVGKGDTSRKPEHTGKARHRLLLLPSKTLPDPGRARARNWAFVEHTSADLEEVEDKLDRYSYSTKTRGDRTQEPARLVGEARYEIVLHENGHTHFVYELEIPKEPEAVQKAFHIHHEGQFLVQVKNPSIQTPARENPRYATLGQKAAKLPEHLQSMFAGKIKDQVRYAPLKTTEFFDIPHVEFVFIGTTKDAHQEFDKIVTEMEREVEEEERQEIEQERLPEDHTYKELHVGENRIPNAVHEFH